MKIIFKQEYLDELEDILHTSLSAHQRAKWGDKKARQMIIKVIMSKFKRVLKNG